MSDSSVLSVTVDASERSVSVMSVGGEIDMLTAAELGDHLDEVIARGVPVVVDLSGVSFIDSSGLREIHRASDLGQVLLVVEPEATVARVVALSGFGEEVPVFGDVTSAKRRIASAE